MNVTPVSMNSMGVIYQARQGNGLNNQYLSTQCNQIDTFQKSEELQKKKAINFKGRPPEWLKQQVLEDAEKAAAKAAKRAAKKGLNVEDAIRVAKENVMQRLEPTGSTGKVKFHKLQDEAEALGINVEERGESIKSLREKIAAKKQESKLESEYESNEVSNDPPNFPWQW